MVTRSVQYINGVISAKMFVECDDKLSLFGDVSELADLLGYDENGAELLAKESLMTLTANFDYVKERMTSESVYSFIVFKRPFGGEMITLFRGRKCVIEGKELIAGMLIEAEEMKRVTDQRISDVLHYRTKLTETESMLSNLQVRAEQDSLTALYNTRTTRRLVEEYISNPENRSALIMLDIDDYKYFNDRYGHMVGDMVLVRVAAVIRKLFRSNDIVGRVGGDEFLVLMKDVSDAETVTKRCRQINEAFEKIRFEQVPDLRLSCSVGAAIYSGEAEYDDFFCKADEAMYAAKDAGGHRFIIYGKN